MRVGGRRRHGDPQVPRRSGDNRNKWHRIMLRVLNGMADRGIRRISESIVKIVGIGEEQHVKPATLEGAADMLPKLSSPLIESYQRARQSPCTDHMVRRIVPQNVGKLHFLNHALASGLFSFS